MEVQWEEEEIGAVGGGGGGAVGGGDGGGVGGGGDRCTGALHLTIWPLTTPRRSEEGQISARALTTLSCSRDSANIRCEFLHK